MYITIYSDYSLVMLMSD